MQPIPACAQRETLCAGVAESLKQTRCIILDASIAPWHALLSRHWARSQKPLEQPHPSFIFFCHGIRLKRCLAKCTSPTEASSLCGKTEGPSSVTGLWQKSDVCVKFQPRKHLGGDTWTAAEVEQQFLDAADVWCGLVCSTVTAVTAGSSAHRLVVFTITSARTKVRSINCGKPKTDSASLICLQQMCQYLCILSSQRSEKKEGNTTTLCSQFFTQ